MAPVAKGQKTISSFFAARPTPPSQNNSDTHRKLAISSNTPPATSPASFAETPKSQDEHISEDENDAGATKSSRSLKRNLKSFASAPTPEPKRRKATPSPDREALQERQTPNGRIVPQVARQDSSKVSDRTSRFLFKTNALDENHADDVDSEPDDIEWKKQRERLHQRFVKKLGRPDSIAEIKRRNHFIEDATGGDEDAVAAEENEEDGGEEYKQPEKPKKGTAGAKKTATKLTPMEKQVIDIKRKHMDTLLVVEVGYKYRFFGEDARVAAKELSIVCIPGKFRFDEHPSEAHLDRFASASIPTHRLHVHVRRLVEAGHKVGVVRQLETAALKAAGDNRNAPFVRKLTNLYTKGTYIDDGETVEIPTNGPSGGAPSGGYLLCLTETNAKGWGTDEKVHVGLVAVQPGTGDIVYDDFEDGFMRSEIETRLLHISPCEFLVVGDLSKATEKLIKHLSGSRANVFGERARLERVPKPKLAAAESFDHISKFYSGKAKAQSEASTSSTVLDKVHNLTEHVTICLSAMIRHLTDFGLEHVFDLTNYFQPFSARSYMLLNGNTLNSLEIYRNQTDGKERGSLFWVLDQTQTRFGQRLLRKWVGRPLLDKTKLQERIDAVEEFKDADKTVLVEKMRTLLGRIKGDLEKSLIRIYYGKCTRPELLTTLQTLQSISSEYATLRNAADAGFDSDLINNGLMILPRILETVLTFLEKINAQSAKVDDKYAFFHEDHQSDEITAHKIGIAEVEQQLDAFRTEAAQKLKKRPVEYVTVAGIDYLIEVDNTKVKAVPASWVKISGTRKVSRFHSPEVLRLIRERDQHKEALAAACDAAFASLLTDISTHYQAFRDVIQSLATFDCLLSLADVASRPDYCKPTFTSSTRIAVSGARHPMVEQILLDTYVPNDISLSPAQRALLITGPNMGGKSSYVRSVALVAIMGQIGSYVPAASAELGMLDAVYTRMGAHDNMLKGESTFMVELSETADILKQAGPRSLVIMDELGRGTSTHDGVAIAAAVLDHVVRESMSLLLFITHYQSLAGLAKGFSGGGDEQPPLRNVHMRFEESGGGGGGEQQDGEQDRDNDQDITFLYEIGEGVAHRSYGLNVARLAGLPKSVLELAREKSAALEREMRGAQVRRLAGLLGKALDVGGSEGVMDALVEGIEQL